MSILDRLKDLVEALEADRGETEEEAQETETKEEPIPEPPVQEPVEAEEPAAEEEVEVESEEEVEPEEQAIEEIPDYLECSEEESRKVQEKLLAVKKAKQTLAELLLDFEQKKLGLAKFISSTTDEFYADLNSLRLEYGVPEEGYTVQLPSSQSDRVSFKKD